MNPDHGAFQTYTLLREIAGLRIPKSMSFEQGATFPMAYSTASAGLFADLGIPRPMEGTKQTSALLVWGASSSVGTAVVQLAKLLGFTVFATASPKHYAYVKSLGVTQAFDYHDADVVAQVVAAAKASGTPIAYGFDAISENGTSELSAQVLAASSPQGSKLVMTLPYLKQEAAPKGVEIFHVAAYRVFLDQADLGAWFFNEWLSDRLEDGTVVAAPPVEIVPGGVGGAQAALDKLKAGVSAVKLVLAVE